MPEIFLPLDEDQKHPVGKNLPSDFTPYMSEKEWVQFRHGMDRIGREYRYGNRLAHLIGICMLVAGVICIVLAIVLLAPIAFFIAIVCFMAAMCTLKFSQQISKRWTRRSLAYKLKQLCGQTTEKVTAITMEVELHETELPTRMGLYTPMPTTFFSIRVSVHPVDCM